MAFPTGPEMVVRFPFEPKAEQPAGARGPKSRAKEYCPIGRTTGAARDSPLPAIDRAIPSNPAITILLSRIERLAWAWSKTADVPHFAPLSLGPFAPKRFCPEAYIHLVIPPGQTAHWNIRYRSIPIAAAAKRTCYALLGTWVEGMWMSTESHRRSDNGQVGSLPERAAVLAGRSRWRCSLPDTPYCWPGAALRNSNKQRHG